MLPPVFCLGDPMLSYRHAFHSGNFADVQKHLVLCLLLRLLRQKDSPFSVIDTHAGAGIYSEDSDFASKNREYLSGIEKVIGNKALRELVPEYYAAIDKLRAENPKALPGSPYFEQLSLRQSDHLMLMDLHPADEDTLHRVFHRDHRISVQRRDAMKALGAAVPPLPRRGLCFIDPSYEEKDDYEKLVRALKTALRRWPSGIYAVWYPILARLADRSKNLTAELKHLNVPLLDCAVRVMPQPEEHGMCGSGMLILNYPYALPPLLEKLMPPLREALCDEEGEARLRILTPRP